MPREHYTDGEVSVSYDPEVCTHAARCVKGLPSVFDVSRKPWVNPGGAAYDEVAAQVAKCPSGALGISRTSAPT